MATPTTDLLEIILRECAGARPQPWYPYDYARDTGLPRDALDEPLDRLRLGGLVRLTDWVQGKGQGYTLTPAGERVLARPRLLDRLREGVVPRAEPPAPRFQEEQAPGLERARAVRDALLDRSRPVATLGLIAANALVFLVGAALAARQDVLTAYLETPLTARVQQGADLQADAIRHQLGSLNRLDVLVENEWWRLLTTCFVHIGFIHILMNMYALYVLGPLLERMWGPARFLLLYLIAGLAGSCAALIFSPAPGVAGASGAICGILGAMAAWVYLNRPYLPRDLSGSWMRGIVTNVILIVLISMVPGVSASGHFGGGLAGLVAAVPMTSSRFGRGAQRWLGLAGALLVPVVVVAWLAHALAPQREGAEIEYTQKRCYLLLVGAEEVGKGAYDRHIEPLCTKVENGQKIDGGDVKAALAEADRSRQQIGEVAAALPEPGSSHDARVNAALEIAQDYVRAWDRLFEKFEKAFGGSRAPSRREAAAILSIHSMVNRYTKQLKDSVLVPSHAAGP
jgi:membrane associated rhomboid family serine protease